jgi:hypothetical protein
MDRASLEREMAEERVKVDSRENCKTPGGGVRYKGPEISSWLQSICVK